MSWGRLDSITIFRSRRQETDITQYQHLQSRLKNGLDKAERTLSKSKLKEQQTAEKLQSVESKLKSEKGEVRVKYKNIFLCVFYVWENICLCQSIYER